MAVRRPTSRAALALGIALAALSAGWVLGSSPGARPPAPEPPSTHVAREPAQEAPTLRGPPAPREEGPGPAPPEDAPSAPAGVPPRRTPSERAAALAAEIRRDVEPAAWTGDGGARIAVQGDSLVVRAERDLQGAVRAYLDGRRDALARAAPAPGADAQGVGEDPLEASRARAEMRRLLLGMLAEHEALLAARAALAGGDPDGARRLLQASASGGGKPAASVLAQWEAGTPVAEILPLHALPWRIALDAWPSAFGSVEAATALAQAKRRAATDHVGRRGTDRARVLDLGPVTLRTSPTTLGRAVALLAAEALVSLAIDERVGREVEDHPVGPLDAVDRPLRGILEDLISDLAPCAWRTTPARILLTRPDLPPLLVTEIHGVADLVAQDPDVDPSLHLQGADGRPGGR